VPRHADSHARRRRVGKLLRNPPLSSPHHQCEATNGGWRKSLSTPQSKRQFLRVAITVDRIVRQGLIRDGVRPLRRIGIQIVHQHAPRRLSRPVWKPLDLLGEPGGTRTHGPKIKSLVLYHLSYGLFRIYIKYLRQSLHPLRRTTRSGITATARLAPPL
jgi:hypothetical protein